MKHNLPTFERSKVHVLKGETANEIIAAMIREITADPNFIKITVKPEGVIEIALVTQIPAPSSEGDFVLTAQDGVIQWEAIEDC